METPDAVTIYALKKANEQKCITILNPAPARKIDENNFQLIDILKMPKMPQLSIQKCLFVVIRFIYEFYSVYIYIYCNVVCVLYIFMCACICFVCFV